MKTTSIYQKMTKQFDLKIKKPTRSQMCQLGYHIVKGHQRTYANGTETWVDTHVRKNHGKHTIYLPENLLYLYWNNKLTFSNLNAIKGYLGYHEIDSIIQFWLEYWKGIFSQFPEIDPLLIKALIAKESSFNHKADPNVSHSSAYGLMQIVDSARNALSGNIQSSVTQHFINVEREDLVDPVINIAVGIRWLVVKYFNVSKRKGDKTHNLIKAYYGHKDTHENEKYLQRALLHESALTGPCV